MVAAQGDDLRFGLRGEAVEEVDDLGGLLAAIHVVAEEDERVLLVERGELADDAKEGLEIAVDVTDRERSIRHISAILGFAWPFAERKSGSSAWSTPGARLSRC